MANIKSILMLFVFVMAAAAWYEISTAGDEVAALTVTVDKLQSELIAKETELTNLTNAVTTAESEKQSLINERQLIAEIQIKRELKLKQTENEYETALQLISKLKANENETISNWASNRIPFDVGGMLRYATGQTDNKNDNSNQAGADDATGRVHYRLQSSSNF